MPDNKSEVSSKLNEAFNTVVVHFRDKVVEDLDRAIIVAERNAKEHNSVAAESYADGLKLAKEIVDKRANAMSVDIKESESE